jgi:thymidylate kinase
VHVPLVNAIDGFDGSGKTTLAKGLNRHLTQVLGTCQIIGKRIHDSSATTKALTRDLLRIEGGLMQISGDANLHLRMARLEERFSAIRQDAKVVLFDRWLLSELAQLELVDRENELGVDREHYRLAPDLTIFLSCPFDLSWSRVLTRKRTLPPRQALGVPTNRDLHRALETIAIDPP